MRTALRSVSAISSKGSMWLAPIGRELVQAVPRGFLQKCDPRGGMDLVVRFRMERGLL